MIGESLSAEAHVQDEPSKQKKSRFGYLNFV